MPNASNLSFLGVARETTKGTGLAPTAFIPVKTLDPVDNIAYLDDTGMRGSMVDVYNTVPGPSFSEVTLAGDVFADTFPWLTANIMGEIATTGASAPFSHALTVRNSGDGQPGSLSLTDHYGLSGGTPSRRFAGCQVSELTVKWTAEGLFEWSGKTVGIASTTVARPTASWSTIAPLQSWLGSISIGGSPRLFVQQGEIAMKRATSPIHTVDGTQAPYSIWCGPLDVSGKMTFVHEDDTELSRYLGATNAVLVCNWQTGAGATLQQVQATMSRTQYKVASVKRGKTYVELEVDFKALANTTDVGASGGFGQIRWVVQNAVAAGTYHA